MPDKAINNDLVTKGFLKNYLNQELTKFRDKILTAVDAVMKEVVAMREEQTLHFHKKTREWPKSKVPPPRWPEGTPRTVGRLGYAKLVLIVFLVSLLSPLPAWAARLRVRVQAPPSGGTVRSSAYGGASSSVRLRFDRKALTLSLSNMGNVSSVSYELIYLANGISQGVMGSVDPSLEPTVTRELLFGTCSAGVCTYHQNIQNMRLKVTSKLTSGLTVVKPYRIKP